MYHLKPEDLPFWDGKYWPEGIPKDDKTPVTNITFQERNGEEFRISYTQRQIMDNARRNAGVWFPFIPLGISGTQLAIILKEDIRQHASRR